MTNAVGMVRLSQSNLFCGDKSVLRKICTKIFLKISKKAQDQNYNSKINQKVLVLEVVSATTNKFSRDMFHRVPAFRNSWPGGIGHGCLKVSLNIPFKYTVTF